MLQFYACCIFESLESNWSRHNEHRNSLYNFMIRVLVRGGYTIISTFVACLLPFFGDFISLTGSLCMMPLDLVLVLALFVKVRSNNNELAVMGETKAKLSDRFLETTCR